MKIRMKISTPGSNNGFTPKLFVKGAEYLISKPPLEGGNEIINTLARTFVEVMGVATYVDESESKFVRKDPEPEEKAVIEVTPEVKVEVKVEPKPVLIEKEEDKSELKNIRVYQVAKDLKMPWGKVTKAARKLGINANAAQSGLTEDEAKKIKASFKG